MATAKSPEPMPSYYECVTDVIESTKTFLSKSDPNYSYPWDFFRDLKKIASFTNNDIILLVGLAVVWTVLRYAMTVGIFSPLGRALQMSRINQTKFPESAFKLIFYSCTWAWSIYTLLILPDYDYFQRPSYIWQDWHAGMKVDTYIYVTYIVQCSFYLHSVYGTLFMDHWRKDSLVMLFHHFLTLSLIGYSYVIRYHKIGALVLLVHDVTDICLEFTKCNVYLKNRGKKYYAFHDLLSTVGFLLFASTWFVFRLYWFPLKIVHSASNGSLIHSPDNHVPFWFFFNVMLWTLQFLNIYWFTFILNFLYKVATGQISEVDDVREHEVDEKIESIKKTKDDIKNANINGTSDYEASEGGEPMRRSTRLRAKME